MLAPSLRPLPLLAPSLRPLLLLAHVGLVSQIWTYPPMPGPSLLVSTAPSSPLAEACDWHLSIKTISCLPSKERKRYDADPFSWWVLLSRGLPHRLPLLLLQRRLRLLASLRTVRRRLPPLRLIVYIQTLLSRCRMRTWLESRRHAVFEFLRRFHLLAPLSRVWCSLALCQAALGGSNSVAGFRGLFGFYPCLWLEIGSFASCRGTSVA